MGTVKRMAAHVGLTHVQHEEKHAVLPKLPRLKSKARKPKVKQTKAEAGMPDIDSYEKIREIGSGASGEVWICRNSLTKSYAAMKIIRSKTRDEKRWAKKELKGLLAIENLLPKPDTLIDIRHAQKTGDGLGICYIMPLADGVDGVGPKSMKYKALTLGHRLRKGCMLGLRESAEIALRIVEGLRTLHSFKLIHRDVKPDNVIFIKGKAVLADIGLVTDDRDSVSFSGTPLYFETGKRPSSCGDLYALGKVLYQMINGKSPNDFPDAGSRTDNADMHLFAPLNEVCMCACGDEDERRYRDADGMIDDLRKVLSSPDKSVSTNPIDLKYAELGGAGGFLGDPTHEERFCPDGVGRYRTYSNPSGLDSSIHWHPDLGAFETHGGIRAEWGKRNWENSFLGYPVSDEEGFTDADYMRDILKTPAARLPNPPRVIGRRSFFQGGCVVWISDLQIRESVGEFVVFCRPVSGSMWKIATGGKASAISGTIKEFIPGNHESVLPDKVSETDLGPGYAQEAYLRSVQGLTSDSDRLQDIQSIVRKVPPVWSQLQSPDAFAWNGYPGYLYKMTAPSIFIRGQPELNGALSKVRVAIFFPENYEPDTPMVYALANTGEDYWSNACMLPVVLKCGFGMVTMDTPLTGIAKLGADMISGAAVNVDNNFKTALTAVINKCGGKPYRSTLFYHHVQEFVARNLLLTQHFLTSTFGVVPKKTVLLAVRNSVATAGYAFTSKSFGDVMLGCIGVSEGTDLHVSSFDPSPTLKYLTDTFADLFKGSILDFSKTARSSKLKLAFDSETLAGHVKPPREVHLLCANIDNEFPSALIRKSLDKFVFLDDDTTLEKRIFETDKPIWQKMLSRRLHGNKSVTWFDGGADLSDWRGDLRLAFLDTKLRMLNRRRS